MTRPWRIHAFGSASTRARHARPANAVRLDRRIAASADLLTPLYDDLKAAVLASTIIHTDDTGVPVLDHDRTETRQGRLWVYIGDGHPADIVYDYTADRTRAGPLAFLQDFRGYPQADAYAGYDALYATGRVVEVVCWAHARRYFFDAKASDPARALPALGFIQQLHAVEREVKGGTPRRAARGASSRPSPCSPPSGNGWTPRPTALPKSPIGDTVRAELLPRHWQAAQPPRRRNPSTSTPALPCRFPVRPPWPPPHRAGVVFTGRIPGHRRRCCVLLYGRGGPRIGAARACTRR